MAMWATWTARGPQTTAGLHVNGGIPGKSRRRRPACRGEVSSVNRIAFDTHDFLYALAFCTTRKSHFIASQLLAFGD